MWTSCNHQMEVSYSLNTFSCYIRIPEPKQCIMERGLLRSQVWRQKGSWRPEDNFADWFSASVLLRPGLSFLSLHWELQANWSENFQIILPGECYIRKYSTTSESGVFLRAPQWCSGSLSGLYVRFQSLSHIPGTVNNFLKNAKEISFRKRKKHHSSFRYRSEDIQDFIKRITWRSQTSVRILWKNKQGKQHRVIWTCWLRPCISEGRKLCQHFLHTPSTSKLELDMALPFYGSEALGPLACVAHVNSKHWLGTVLTQGFLCSLHDLNVSMGTDWISIRPFSNTRLLKPFPPMTPL